MPTNETSTANLHVVMTGATGFIGAAIVKELLLQGSRVTVLLRPTSDSSRLTGLDDINTLTYSQLSDEQLAADLTAQHPDVFVHCGWRGVGGQDRNQAFQIRENLPTTLDSVELAAAAGCCQWIGLGSQAEYGNPNCRTSEDASLNATNLYGKAKAAAGIAALALCEACEISGAWLRVFSTYGPGDAPHWFMPYVIQEMLAGRSPNLTKCEQLWDYLYVADAANAVASAANGKTAGVYNLGSGTARPLKDYIEAIRNELEVPAEPAYGAVTYGDNQVMHLEADISRLTAATGWQPKTTLEQGVRALVEFERTRPAAAASNS